MTKFLFKLAILAIAAFLLMQIPAVSNLTKGLKASIDEKVNNVTTEYERVKEKVTGVEQQIDETKKKVTDVADEVSGTIKKVGDTVTSVNKALDGMSDALKGKETPPAAQ